MTQNVAARLDVRSKKSTRFRFVYTHFLTAPSTDDIPIGIFTQMTTCQTAANEFLRQYWSATLPQPPELQTAATATSAQRAAKAVKMIGYLAKTPEKVAAIVMQAQSSNVDAAKVEMVSSFRFRAGVRLANSRVVQAMKPVLESVNRAIAYHQTREAAALQRRK